MLCDDTLRCVLRHLPPGTCQVDVRTRDATRAILTEDYEEHLARLLSAMRIRCSHEAVRRRWMLRLAHEPEPRIPKYACAFCGDVRAGGVGECTCARRAPFPLRRVLLGPCVACFLLVALARLRR